MKIILFIMLCFFYLFSFRNVIADNDKFSFCYPEFWLNVIHKCYDSTEVNYIKNEDENEYIYSGGNLRFDSNCIEIDTIFTIHNVYSLYDCFDFESRIYYDFMKSMNYSTNVPYIIEHGIRYSIYRHLRNEEYDYLAYLDSAYNAYQVQDSLERLNETADTIRGAYIPYDLDDAMRLLDLYLEKYNPDEYKEMSEDEFLGSTHFGWGMTIRNYWGLWGYSRIRTYLINLGIKHPDKMSSFILTSYHRRLKGVEYDLEELIKEHSD